MNTQLINTDLLIDFLAHLFMTYYVSTVSLQTRMFSLVSNLFITERWGNPTDSTRATALFSIRS